MSYTPGPWRADETATVRNSEGWIIAEVLGGGAGVPEMHPNARLIAAAPDLLRLLKSAAQTLRHQPCCGQDPDWITSCRNIASFAEEAISNAEAPQTTTDGSHSTPEATPGIVAGSGQEG
jgi:hypothetical protein